MPAQAARSSYSLLEAVEQALAENFRIMAAEEDLAAGENARKGALSAFGPSLTSSYGVSRQEHVSDDRYTWRLSLTQDLFSGFSTLASYQKAALQKDNAEARLAQTRINLILQVQQNFLLYLKAEADVRSALDSYNRLAEQLKVTRSFYDVGLRPRVEVLQAEVNVSEAEDLLLRGRNSVETQRVRLNTLLNLPAHVDVQYTGSLEHIPFAGDLDQCLEKADRQRPDLNIARKSVDIAEQDQTIARSRFLPQLSASASWSSSGDDWKAAGGRNYLPDDYRSWSVGLNAS
ncbi:MAG: TolC family protein, partial [Desulfovibrionaceae bacterium]|nr:TolC family protein [Desulfovibrionaceae bacterium]